MSIAATDLLGQSPPTQASPAKTRVRTADLLVDILIGCGVDTFFGLPGSTISPLHDALLDRPQVRVVSTRHESGAMFAAAAYAQKTGKPGVVLVTSGPGVLNCMTGLASAHCDGLPIVLLAGEVPRKNFGKQALQEGTAHHLNVVGMTQHVAKLSLEVPSPELAPAMLRRAVHTALSGRRGPVILTLPLDVTLAQIDPPKLVGTPTVSFTIEHGGVIEEVVEALWRADRPVLLAGSGTRWAGGPAAVRALAERLQCPVICTPKAKGVFPESHPLSLGVFGHGGHPSATAYLQGGVDTLVAVGSGLRDPATDGWSDLLRAREHFIQIDTDAAQMGRVYPVTHGIVGEAESVLTHIVSCLPQQPRAPRRLGVERASEARDERVGPSGLLTPQRALWELQHSLPVDAMFASDIGEHLLFATHYLHIDLPDAYYAMTGLASMGSSIAAAMGAKLANPARTVAAICGDGCFAMAASDVMTVAHERVPIVIAVLNDFRYGMVELGHERAYGRRPSYPLGSADVAAIAQAAGAQALTLKRPGELLQSGLAALLRDGPVVLDIHVDPATRMMSSKRNESLFQSVPRHTLN